MREDPPVRRQDARLLFAGWLQDARLIKPKPQFR
jgi:hypothetical protein